MGMTRKPRNRLTAERAREVLSYNPETGAFMWRKTLNARGLVGSVAGTSRSNGYRIIGVDGVPYLAHRLAWLMVHGAWPRAEVDHANGNPGDNRLCNLREANRSQNCKNIRVPKDNTSGALGVSWFGQTQRWRARIVCDGVEISLGYFRSKDDAIAARKAAEQKYFGEFARA
jgi:hypothetical protein